MATVFGTIILPDLTPFVGRVGFMPDSGAPVGHALSTVGWQPVVAQANEAGFFTKGIAAGSYWVHVGNALRRHVLIADDSKFYLLQDLLGDGPFGILPQNYRTTPGGIQFINATTGAFHAMTLTGEEDSIGWRIYAQGEVLPSDTYKVVGDTAFFRADLNGPWHAPFLSDDADSPVMSFAPADAAVDGGNFRVSGSRWQLRNVTTGQHHNFFVVGAAGEESWAIGPGE